MDYKIYNLKNKSQFLYIPKAGKPDNEVRDYDKLSPKWLNQQYEDLKNFYIPKSGKPDNDVRDYDKLSPKWLNQQYKNLKNFYIPKSGKPDNEVREYDKISPRWLNQQYEDLKNFYIPKAGKPDNEIKDYDNFSPYEWMPYNDSLDAYLKNLQARLIYHRLPGKKTTKEYKSMQSALRRIIDDDYILDKEYIPKAKSNEEGKPRIGMLDPIGIWSETNNYKSYHFEFSNTLGQPAGSFADHVMYFNPLDRSYIPYTWLPRIEINKDAASSYPDVKINAPLPIQLLTDKIYQGVNYVQDKAQNLANKAKAAVSKLKYALKLSDEQDKHKFSNAPSWATYYGVYKNKTKYKRKLTLFGSNISLLGNVNDKIVVNDPLSYQAQSYMSYLYDVSDPKQKNIIANENRPQQFSYDQGNIIKFWIQDANNQLIMTTPAFLTNLEDQGLSGEWDEFKYVGATYPKFQYKGSTKRTIKFDLKIGCFEKKYIRAYLQKLNFLRLVGTPSYKEVYFTRQDLGDTQQTFPVLYPRAPLYKLTLGDIIRDTYGYFESCDLTWSDEEATWNLDKKKILKGLTLEGGRNFQDMEDSRTDGIGQQQWIGDDNLNNIQFPIVTSVACTFVCMYGLGFTNTIDRSNYQNFIYKPTESQ